MAPICYPLAHAASIEIFRLIPQAIMTQNTASDQW